MEEIDVDLYWKRDRKRLRWIDEGLDEIEIRWLEKIAIDLDGQEDRKRLTLIDER